MAQESITHSDFLDNYKCVQECTGHVHASTITNENGTKMWRFDNHEYGDFDMQIDSLWVFDNVIEIVFDLRGEMLPPKWRKDHKKALRNKLLELPHDIHPPWIVPVSTTRPSEVRNGKWFVYLGCQAAKDGCTVTIIISSIIKQKHYQTISTIKITVEYVGYPCLHPRFLKLGWIESSLSKLELSQKTARQSQTDYQSTLDKDIFWNDNNHVCVISFFNKLLYAFILFQNALNKP